MHHKTLTALLCTLCATAATALADSEVVVESAGDGTPTLKAPLTVDTKISFSATEILIDNGGNIQSAPYSDLSKVRFQTSASGIAPVQDEAAGYALLQNPVESLLHIAGYAGHPVPLAVTAMNGHTVYRTSAWQGEAIGVESLNPGLYLVTIDNKTIKFIKK